MNKRIRIAILAAGLAAAMPVMAQGTGSDGYRLLTAVKQGDGAAATAILETPGSTAINARDDDGNGVLHLVVRDRNGTWLSYFLAKGANPDIADEAGNTPLILAAQAGYADGVSRLLRARAAVNKENRQGVTPLIAAVQGKHAGVVRILLEAGADPDKADFAAGFSARDYARRETRSRQLLQLIESVKPKNSAAQAGPARP